MFIPQQYSAYEQSFLVIRKTLSIEYEILPLIFFC